ncbi:aldo/keto reductase [Candidatus Bathyarchaeota archaeon]|nr:MAG: aldo/keto reductase [Candidatus Bathyarchaeota archaeon]TMI76427.1 MAG: aldo/keto reductase [Candidatus Bathyarchaeota archaeon]
METQVANLTINSTVRLNNQVQMPILGLGVYQTPPGRVTQNAVKYALTVGYRHIDTARIYGNEADVGEAIRESGVPRKDLFVTTKLWNSDQGYDSTLRACEASLKRIGLDYLDLYLIHFPVSETRGESWKAMETLLEKGKCRSIGVSNFTIGHLEELLGEYEVTPAVNQVEFHPFLYQKELLEYCQTKGIQVEAYSPLARGERFKHPRIISLATKYSKTPAQLMIRWGIQQRLVVIPKSTREERIRENSQVFDFDISDDDMRSLDSLNEGLRLNWDPTNVP